MHSLSFTTACCVALCLTTSFLLANGQYKTSSPYQQRKMAPVPASYAPAAPANDYGQQEQGYGQQAAKYSAPSSASTSQYDERQQSASYGAPAKASYGAASQGYGKQKYEEPQYPPMPFAWGYDINDGYGGAQYHKENGDEYGKRTGSYGYTDAYGIYRQVDYVADEYGFRATIKTNEPGTANESPADVDLHAYEPPSNYYAGNTQSYGSSSGAAPSYGSSSASSSSSYQQAAPAKPASSYATKSASSYSSGGSSSSYAPKMQQPSAYQRSQYSSPAASYARQPSQASYQQPMYQQQQQQDYAGSVLVPVYQKLGSAPNKKIHATRHI